MVNMNKKEPSIIKTWFALAACAIVFCTMVMSLAGCSNGEDKNKCMEDQCLILVTPRSEEARPIYINTHYILKITPLTYYDYNVIRGNGSIDLSKPDRDHPHEGSVIHFSDGSTVQIKELPNEIVSFTSGV